LAGRGSDSAKADPDSAFRIGLQCNGYLPGKSGGKCGFFQTYLSRVERGQANPTINALEVIANGLGMTVFELFDRVREQMPPPRKRRWN